MSNPADRRVRFGILGCARIVKRSIAAAIRGSQCGELAAIASRSLEQAQKWSADLSIPRAYGSYEELIQDPNIDAVYIPLPNELHRPWVLRAAEAGKHVLCEKPLALNAVEAEAMVAGVQRHGRILMEAFMWRHHPRTQFVCDMIDDGRMGEVRLVTLDFSIDIDRKDWRLDPKRGGGALFDLGCYGINAARLFTGEEPNEVYARCVRSKTKVDMSTAVTLCFPSGAMAQLDCSFECPPRTRLEVVGTKAAVEIPGGVLPETTCELFLRSGGITQTFRFPLADQYANQVDIFCRSIAAGELIEPAEDGLANMKVLDEVKKGLEIRG